MEKLPEEKFRNVSRRKVILVAVLPVVFFFMFNTFFYFYFHFYNPNEYYFLLNRKLSLLKKIDRKIDWLILGDSSGNQGIDPSIISDSLGGSSVNLCTYADMTLIDDCWMLDYLIKKDLAPSNVIISRVYDTWSRSVNYTLYSQYPASWVIFNRNKPEVPPPAGTRFETIVNHLFPVIHQKRQVINLIEHPSEFFTEPVHVETDGFFRYQGEADPYGVRRDARGHLDYVSKYDVKIGHYNLAALKFLQEVSAREGINIYLCNSPVYDSLLLDRQFSAFYERLTDSLETYTEGFLNFKYINHPATPFPDSLLQNVDHVTEQGSVIFTDLIIKQIKQSTKMESF